MEIRGRAHEIYVQRGYVHGFDLEDWLQAEGELKRNGNNRTSVSLMHGRTVRTKIRSQHGDWNRQLRSGYLGPTAGITLSPVQRMDILLEEIVLADRLGLMCLAGFDLDDYDSLFSEKLGLSAQDS